MIVKAVAPKAASPAVTAIPPITGLDRSQLLELVTSCREQMEALNAKDQKAEEERLKALRNTPAGKKVTTEYEALLERYELLTDTEVKSSYNVPITITSGFYSSQDLRVMVLHGNELEPEHLPPQITCVVGKIEGLSPLARKQIQQEVENVVDGACDEIRVLMTKEQLAERRDLIRDFNKWMSKQNREEVNTILDLE
jgi:hypothetical protein